MKSVQRKGNRKVRKSVLVVGIVLLVSVGFLLVKTVASVFKGSGPLAFTETLKYTINEDDKTEFYIDYTNSKSLNKVIESEILEVFEKNEDLFSNKDKKIRAVINLNEKHNIASYLFTDYEGNVEEIYGTVNVDLNNKEVLKSDDLLVDELKGLSMLVREELAKDDALTFNKNTYLKTIPEKESFKLMTLEEEGVVYHYRKDALDTDTPKKASIAYSEAMPYFSDVLIKRLDKDFERPENLEVRYIDPLKPMLAMTFDDGPKADTSGDLAQHYAENDSRVTFFWLGSRVEENKDVVKKLSDLGHEIANHSYDHPNFNNISDEDLKYQTEAMNKQIMDITNQSRVLIRPPYGAANADTRPKIESPLIMWSVDTLDWKTRDAEASYQEMMNSASDGAIILLHDLYVPSIEAGKRFLDTQKNNYQFVTVSELYQYKGVALENGKLHFGTSK